MKRLPVVAPAPAETAPRILAVDKLAIQRATEQPPAATKLPEASLPPVADKTSKPEKKELPLAIKPAAPSAPVPVVASKTPTLPKTLPTPTVWIPSTPDRIVLIAPAGGPFRQPYVRTPAPVYGEVPNFYQPQSYYEPFYP